MMSYIFIYCDTDLDSRGVEAKHSFGVLVTFSPLTRGGGKARRRLMPTGRTSYPNGVTLGERKCSMVP